MRVDIIWGFHQPFDGGDLIKIQSHMAMGQNPAIAVNIRFNPTTKKRQPTMGGEFTNPKMVSQNGFDHSQIQVAIFEGDLKTRRMKATAGPPTPALVTSRAGVSDVAV